MQQLIESFGIDSQTSKNTRKLNEKQTAKKDSVMKREKEMRR